MPGAGAGRARVAPRITSRPDKKKAILYLPYPNRPRRCSMSLISRLLDILLPDGGYAVDLVEAYFDESGSHDGSPVLCVAGYLFKKEDCIKLDVEWKNVLDHYKLPYFRMSECAHGNGAFSDLSKDKRISAQKRMINLIKANMAYGFSVSLEMKFAHLISKNAFIKSPYTLCCYWCLQAMRNWANDNDYKGDIAYFFESGHKSQGEANWVMNEIFNMPELKHEYRYANHSFADKAKVRPLQCADILAWQWHKYVKERMKGKEKCRADLFSLLEVQHFTWHFDENALRNIASIDERTFSKK